MLASRTCGREENFDSIHSTVGSTGRVYIHEMSPRAKKFFERSASRGLTPSSLHASSVRLVIGTCTTWYDARDPLSSGLASYPTLVRFRSSNASEFTRIVEPGGSSFWLALAAAGFIATSTLGASPGVTMSWSEMCTWNDETPAMVPAGARISAG